MVFGRSGLDAAQDQQAKGGPGIPFD